MQAADKPDHDGNDQYQAKNAAKAAPAIPAVTVVAAASEHRTLWRVTFRSDPPPAFTKDLMARFLCWHTQEQAQGGLEPETAKHLDRRRQPKLQYPPSAATSASTLPSSVDAG